MRVIQRGSRHVLTGRERRKERASKARNPWRLVGQVIGSNVTERTFGIVGPDWMGEESAGRWCVQGGEKREKMAAGRWQGDGTGREAEMAKRLGWRGKR
jgi:hypothetical protein